MVLFKQGSLIFSTTQFECYSRKQSKIHIYHFLISSWIWRVLYRKPDMKMHFFPFPSPPSFYPLQPHVLFVEINVENKCDCLIKYFSGIEDSIHAALCLRGFMAVAGGFLEGDFEQHLKVSWQFISAYSKSQAGCFLPTVFCVRRDFLQVWAPNCSLFSVAEQMPKLSGTFRIPVLLLGRGYKLASGEEYRSPLKTSCFHLKKSFKL